MILILFSLFSGAVQDSDDQNITLHEFNEALVFVQFLWERYLRYYLLSLKERGTSGCDGLHTRDMRRKFETINHVLLGMMNDIIGSGNWPIELKKSVLNPLYTVFAVDDIKIYPPIFFLPCLLQKFKKKNLLRTVAILVNRFCLLSSHHYGFSAARRAQAVVVKFCDNLLLDFDIICWIVRYSWMCKKILTALLLTFVIHIFADLVRGLYFVQFSTNTYKRNFKMSHIKIVRLIKCLKCWRRAGARVLTFVL